MFVSEYHYEQTTLLLKKDMECFKWQDETLPRNWQFILKDSASVLDGVLEENEARKLINLQTKSTVTSHLVPAE